jgi:hypothetical protein
MRSKKAIISKYHQKNNMFKKLCLLFVGFFCSGLFIAQAAEPTIVNGNQQTFSTQQNVEQQINEDRFNFVIANPNTIDPKKFIFELKPGETSSDEVYVKNASDVPLKFSLYGADGTKTAQGSFALRTKNEPLKDVGKWITFDEKEITLQPGEYKKVKFHLEVPSGTPEGTYSGGVAAEKSKPETGNPNVTIAVRIGLRVDVKVTSNPHPASKKYADVVGNPFYQVYFWASLGLFLVSAGALGWSYYSDKKSPKRRPRHAKK